VRLPNPIRYWYKIAGGGGTSTSGQYSLSGTVGQHDSRSPMTNGQYSITGGFWVLPQVIQVSGAPTLSIAPAALGFATVLWAPASPGFVLQESVKPDIGWTNSVSGATNPVTVPTSSFLKFYRLKKL
jgi:hypothetical protein